jgi:hypothetical protein
MLSVFMLSVIMLSVIMLSVIMLSVLDLCLHLMAKAGSWSFLIVLIVSFSRKMEASKKIILNLFHQDKVELSRQTFRHIFSWKVWEVLKKFKIILIDRCFNFIKLTLNGIWVNS